VTCLRWELTFHIHLVNINVDNLYFVIKNLNKKVVKHSVMSDKAVKRLEI